MTIAAAPLPDNVRRTDVGFIARIRRGRRSFTKHFRLSKYPGHEAALTAARSWVDTQRRELPPPANGLGSVRKKTLSHKRTGEPVGVSRTVALNPSNPNCKGSLRFLVNWSDSNGKARIKTFVAGPVAKMTPEREEHAHKSALAFRATYEKNRQAGIPFDPAPFDQWRAMRLY